MKPQYNIIVPIPKRYCTFTWNFIQSLVDSSFPSPVFLDCSRKRFAIYFAIIIAPCTTTGCVPIAVLTLAIDHVIY